jgi:hypothetical protein
MELSEEINPGIEDALVEDIGPDQSFDRGNYRHS